MVEGIDRDEATDLQVPIIIMLVEVVSNSNIKLRELYSCGVGATYSRKRKESHSHTFLHIRMKMMRTISKEGCQRRR